MTGWACLLFGWIITQLINCSLAHLLTMMMIAIMIKKKRMCTCWYQTNWWIPKLKDSSSIPHPTIPPDAMQWIGILFCNCDIFSGSFLILLNSTEQFICNTFGNESQYKMKLAEQKTYFPHTPSIDVKSSCCNLPFRAVILFHWESTYFSPNVKVQQQGVIYVPFGFQVIAALLNLSVYLLLVSVWKFGIMNGKAFKANVDHTRCGDWWMNMIRGAVAW